MYVDVGSGTRLWVRHVQPQKIGSNSSSSSNSPTAVLLLHGFPDDGDMWSSQIQSLAAAGFTVIAPDMLGFGRSDKPPGVDSYALSRIVCQLCLLLDGLGVGRVCCVGHDWGAAVAWQLALREPERVERLVVLSVGHPGTANNTRQRAHWWYMLFFMLPDAEAALTANNWELFKQVMGPDSSSSSSSSRDGSSSGDSCLQVEQYVQQLSRPGALTAALNWYRANTHARHFGQTRPWPAQRRTSCPVLGVWSDHDSALLEPQMTASARFVAPGCWQYVRLSGVGHWIPRQAPAQLNQLLLNFLGMREVRPRL